jgi:hypothetical protein
MNQSSNPNAPLAIRMYVLRDTVIIERPRNTVDKIRIARGRPSGVMVLRFGSTFDTGIDMLKMGKTKSRATHTTSSREAWSRLFPYSPGRATKQPKSQRLSKPPGVFPSRVRDCRVQKEDEMQGKTWSTAPTITSSAHAALRARHERANSRNPRSVLKQMADGRYRWEWMKEPCPCRNTVCVSTFS